MMPRSLLLTLAVAAAFLGAPGTALAEQTLSPRATLAYYPATVSTVDLSRVLLVQKAPSAANPHAGHMRGCIQNCSACHRVCLKSAAYCRKMGGKHADPAHLRILRDCAEICQTSASFMRRGSAFHARTCGLCADICQRCEQSCRQFPNDAQMKACAAACHQCTSSCQMMAHMAM
jgi:hypothetical protein